MPCALQRTYDLPVPSEPVAESPDALGAVAERPVGALVIAAAVVCVVSGAVLAVAYEPHELGWLRSMHTGAGAVAVISAIAGRVLATGGRLRVTGRRALVVLVVVLLLGGVVATGTSLAWQAGTTPQRGMFLGSVHHVHVGDRTVSPGSIAFGFVVHLVLGLCSFVLLAGRYVRLWWRTLVSRP